MLGFGLYWLLLSSPHSSRSLFSGPASVLLSRSSCLGCSGLLADKGAPFFFSWPFRLRGRWGNVRQPAGGTANSLGLNGSGLSLLGAPCGSPGAFAGLSSLPPALPSPCLPSLPFCPLSLRLPSPSSPPSSSLAWVGVQSFAALCFHESSCQGLHLFVSLGCTFACINRGFTLVCFTWGA